jgi:membrane associated rhomboid family serine protease
MSIFEKFATSVTAWLFLACISIFTIQMAIPEFNEIFVLQADRWWRVDTWFTHMFMHGSLWHLLGNMIGVVTVGYFIESVMKSKMQYFKLYIYSGLFAMILQFSFDLMFYGMHDGGYVGASGALCGLIGALAYYMPSSTLLIFFILPVRTKIVFWGFIVISILFYFLNIYTGEGQVAHLAHAGGLISGFFLAKYLSPKLALKVSGYDYNGKEWEAIVLNLQQFNNFIIVHPFKFKWEYAEDSRKMNAKEDYHVSMLTYTVSDIVNKKIKDQEDESE